MSQCLYERCLTNTYIQYSINSMSISVNLPYVWASVIKSVICYFSERPTMLTSVRWVYSWCPVWVWARLLKLMSLCWYFSDYKLQAPPLLQLSMSRRPNESSSYTTKIAEPLRRFVIGQPWLSHLRYYPDRNSAQDATNGLTCEWPLCPRCALNCSTDGNG